MKGEISYSLKIYEKEEKNGKYVKESNKADEAWRGKRV